MLRRGFKTWCESTSVQIRRNLGLEPAAPLAPELLAPSLRADVWSLEEISGLAPDVATRLRTAHASSWSAITLPGLERFVIIYNPAHSHERRASDLMHELSHLLLEHEPGNVFFGPNGLALRTHNQDQEDEARWLSGCLLLNRECLFLVRKKRWTVEEACRYFGVSTEMLVYRQQMSGVDRQFFGRSSPNSRPARGRNAR
jgi:hypothetical protein